MNHSKGVSSASQNFSPIITRYGLGAAIAEHKTIVGFRSAWEHNNAADTITPGIERSFRH